jgi:hypothetical protein
LVSRIEVTLAEYDKRTFPRDCKFMFSRGQVCVDNLVMHAEHFTIHPEYNDENLLNDVALIRLRGNAPYTGKTVERFRYYAIIISYNRIFEKPGGIEVLRLIRDYISRVSMIINFRVFPM